ncbi:MAG: serine/threonine protein kinase [Proteobacteria bacterium]|nr:serine/threonine protein kinase [Pseudomonadota bacterium]
MAREEKNRGHSKEQSISPSDVKEIDNEDHLTSFIETLCRTHASLSEHFSKNPHKSITPPKPDPENIAARSLRILKERKKIAGGKKSLTLEIGKLIGQGGMSVIHEANQISLSRTVAVKTLHHKYPKSLSEIAMRMLIQEAWMTGNLEHPNIMPVYDIELDDEGHPLIVLKRIEGVPWNELIGDAKQVDKRFGEKNLFEWNLGILGQVCNAIHFAHSRGIIHRDLKPENVMIGEFGEVYVLDWGLALALKDDGTGRLPLASKANGIAGTPAYMAPEVLSDVDGSLSEKTDIYQLGAILHEIISGNPPHMGTTQKEIIASVLKSRANLPKYTSVEIASICQRAMNLNPDLRYETADQFRIAIAGFIQHRGSIRLEAQAQKRLDQLMLDLRVQPEDERAHRRHLYNLFGECRFAYKQAIKQWPENDEAIEGLRRAIETMIDYELQRGEVRSAATLMGELENPPDELQRRMQQAIKAKEEEQLRFQKLERIGKQFDRRTGQRLRAIGSLLFGLIFTVAPLVSDWMLNTFWRQDHFTGSVVIAILLIFLVLGGLAQWEELMETAISRRLLRATTFALFGTIVMNAVGYIIGLSYEMTVVLWPFCWFCVSAMLTATVDRRMFPMALGFLIALFASATWPEVRYYALSASNFILAVNMFFIWAPKDWKEQDQTRSA